MKSSDSTATPQTTGPPAKPHSRRTVPVAIPSATTPAGDSSPDGGKATRLSQPMLTVPVSSCVAPSHRSLPARHSHARRSSGTAGRIIRYSRVGPLRQSQRGRSKSSASKSSSGTAPGTHSDSIRRYRVWLRGTPGTITSLLTCLGGRVCATLYVRASGC